MPFAKEFIDVYQLGIKAACDEAGAYCERVDEQIFHENILDRIYNQIAKSDIIISDMSGRNPNVFYETGYAHALGKRPILLTSQADDIPFDLKHYPHIVYSGSIAALKSELCKKVRWCVEHPAHSLELAEPPIEFYIDGKRITQTGLLQLRAIYEGGFHLQGSIDLFNKSSQVVAPGAFQIALVLPSSLGIVSAPCGIATLPSGDIICMLANYEQMFPQAWQSIPLNIRFWNVPSGQAISITVRVFTALGTRDFPLIAVISG